LNDGCFDDDGDEEGGIGRGLKSSGITKGSTDKVPEEFTVGQAPEASPDSVNAGSDCNKTTVFVPDKISHCFKVQTEWFPQ